MQQIIRCYYVPDVKSGSENVKNKRDTVAPQGVYRPMRQNNKKYILRDLFQGIFLYAWGPARKNPKARGHSKGKMAIRNN